MISKTERPQALKFVQKTLLQTSHLAGPHCQLYPAIHNNVFMSGRAKSQALIIRQSECKDYLSFEIYVTFLGGEESLGTSNQFHFSSFASITFSLGTTLKYVFIL